jgi:hypothetical protein
MLVRNLQGLLSSVSKVWCQTTHPSPMWPVNGQYRCPKCLRQFPVPWEEKQAQVVPITAGREPELVATVSSVSSRRAVSRQPAAQSA